MREIWLYLLKQSCTIKMFHLLPSVRIAEHPWIVTGEPVLTQLVARSGVCRWRAKADQLCAFSTAVEAELSYSTPFDLRGRSRASPSVFALQRPLRWLCDWHCPHFHVCGRWQNAASSCWNRMTGRACLMKARIANCLLFAWTLTWAAEKKMQKCAGIPYCIRPRNVLSMEHIHTQHDCSLWEKVV